VWRGSARQCVVRPQHDTKRYNTSRKVTTCGSFVFGALGVARGELRGSRRYGRPRTVDIHLRHPFRAISRPYETPKVSLMVNFTRNRRTQSAWINCVFSKVPNTAERSGMHL
jgi:hypothetical protein